MGGLALQLGCSKGRNPRLCDSRSPAPTPIIHIPTHRAHCNLPRRHTMADRCSVIGAKVHAAPVGTQRTNAPLA
jgi:hypothetical protein